MAAKDPIARSRAASIASHSSWAVTANRSDRTAPARRASPLFIEYWRELKKQELPDSSPKDQLAAARNAHRAYTKRNALKALHTRQAKQAEQAKKKAGRVPAA